MNNTIKITIEINDNNARQIIIAELSDIDFDAFEENEHELSAFIKQQNYNKEKVDKILGAYNLPFSEANIPEQNWNELWESNFEPVVVDDFCAIRADFHPQNFNTKYTINITPKMSFGTGHHATTYMMVSHMRNINFAEMQVADFGTGTGILAILAEKMGAASVWAIDNDEWSIENAGENIKKNSCIKIVLEKTGGFTEDKIFNIILANINRNVIADHASALARALAKSGTLLLSGLLEADEDGILKIFAGHHIFKKQTLRSNGWISILMEH